MVRIRSQNDIILGLLDFYRVAQPQLDTKPGSVARDLAVDGISAQLSRLYEEVARVSTKQSLRFSLGEDLDKWGANFGVARKRGRKANGTALLTFSSIDSDIPINVGDLIPARNGTTFVVTTAVVVSPVFATGYKAIAAQYRSDLDFVGITDEYAVEVLVEASAPGVQGNISKYFLSSTTIQGVSNVTNVVGFSGGTLAEDDATFRNRILSIFSGANVGTALGYRNDVIADPAVIDAIVIEPGDLLMTRDGTEVVVNSSGEQVILSEGTGGKVDVYVFGTRLQEVIDSYVYLDKSNKQDPTNIKNEFVLGAIDGDENKSITRRRLDNLASGVLPQQPINDITQVSGSLSGGNFVEKSVDQFGIISGNYELIKDDGEFGGSPWGFDRLHFISDRVSDFQEDITKGNFNGQDTLSFSDALKISGVEQKISVTNENSKINPLNRSSVQLSHKPITNVTRVFNVTTGERYVVSNQNPDGSGTINLTGRILISGNSLPATSDILQTDYTWISSFDPYIDIDNKLVNTNLRTSGDTIDWGYSNNVRREQATLTSSGSSLLVTTTHPISAVISINVFSDDSAYVVLSSNRLSVVVAESVSNVVSITRNSDGAELYNTNTNDGTFSGFTIFFPTDTLATLDDEVTIIYNAIDVFAPDGYEGSFSDNKITIVPTATALAGSLVEANYIANVNNILPSTQLSLLPAVRNENQFDTTASTLVGNQPTSHIFSDGAVVQNLRLAPTKLSINISGAISPGVITVSGTTMVYAQDIVYTVGTGGLKQNIISAIRKHLGLNSTQSIPSNLRLAKIDKVERVSTVSSTNDTVAGVLNTYDLKGYEIRSNTYFLSESLSSSSLGVTEFKLPETADNSNNVPVAGQKIRISFHYLYTNDSENAYFSKSGTLYTDKTFASIDVVSISSGFTSTSSSTAVITINNYNQPTNGTRYKVKYDYLAPKVNERITIRYNYNKLISDATLSVEENRPINADVLIKEDTSLPVDVTMNIVVSSDFTNNSSTVQQNVQDVLISGLSARELGTTVDASDLISLAYTVNGVDRARILYFNKEDVTGSVLSISANKNEHITPSTVTVVIEER